MGGSKVIVYAVVGVLCVVAAVLAFAGEGTKVKQSETIETSSGCIYPRSPANVLGYIAASLLLIAQITISVATRCVCCRRSSCNSTSACAIICFVFSWIASGIGIDIILSAAYLTTLQQKKIEGIDFEDCILVKTGFFSAGGVLGIVACALGLYAYYSSTKNSPQPAPAHGVAPYYDQGGIAMGHPQYNNNNAAASYPYSKQQQPPYAV